MTTTADTIIELADMALAQAIACSLRVPPQGTWADEADALRTAVESLVAEHDAARAALSAPVPKGWLPFPHYLQHPDGRLLRTAEYVLRRAGHTALADEMLRMADVLLDTPPALSAPVVPQREWCCEAGWAKARDKAWAARETNCGCDHNEYCGKCFPIEFRDGGKWRKYAEPDAAPSPQEQT